MFSGITGLASSYDNIQSIKVTAIADTVIGAPETEETVSYAYVYVGEKNYDGGRSYRSGLRFNKVLIPQGTKIKTAKLTLNSNGTGNNDCNVTIYGEDVDNSAAFSTGAAGYADFNGRTKTTASVAWNSIASNAEGVSFDSPSIITIIQEIIDRAGWKSGNSLSILLYDNSSTSDAYRDFKGYNAGDVTKSATLYIETGTTNSATLFTSRIGDADDDKCIDHNAEEVSGIMRLGADAGSFTSCLRFAGVTVPQGATIQEAYIGLTASNFWGVNTGDYCNYKINGEDADNSAAFNFTTYAQWLADTRTITTNCSTVTNTMHWTDDMVYLTAQITNAVQEIVDREGWVNGNAMSFFLADNPDDWSTSYRCFWHCTTAPNYAAVLIIWYTA